MIIFAWSLTTNQIECLRSIRHWHDAENKLGREPDGDRDGITLGSRIANFHSGCQRLFKEGYISRFDVPVKGPDRTRWTGPTRPKWEITPKGRLVLDLVEMELAQHKSRLMEEIRVVKKLKAV